jgi:hypothetical protein
MFSVNGTLQQSHNGDRLDRFDFHFVYANDAAWVPVTCNDPFPNKYDSTLFALAVSMGNANSSSARRCSTEAMLEFLTNLWGLNDHKI